MTTTFVGGIRRFSGPYVTFPFGRLVLDEETLAIFGVGLATIRPWRVGEVRVRRADVDEVRLSRGYPGVRITVSKAGTPIEPIFLALNAGPVVTALHACGWPVADARRS